jgi:hypothetical protein
LDLVFSSGWNSYAATNNLIIVWPQFTWRDLCTDLWGYTGDDYATKNGMHVQAFKKMAMRLMEPRDNTDHDKYNMLNKWYSWIYSYYPG